MALQIKRKDCTKFKRSIHPANPNCVWCGRLTRLVSTVTGRPDPEDMATIDHVKPRRECATQAEYDAVKNKVMSCKRCNVHRDIADGNRLLARILDEVPMRLWWRVKLFRDAGRAARKCVEHLYYAVRAKKSA